MSDEQGTGLPEPESADDDSPRNQRWVYQHPETKKTPTKAASNALSGIVNHIFMYGVFSVTPLFIFLLIYWLGAKLLANTFLGESWNQPCFYVFAIFFSGILIRVMIEQYMRNMGLFVLALLGFCTAAAICWLDVNKGGSLFSIKYLPEALKLSLLPYLYTSPILGMMGMFCYKWFTLR